MLRRFRTPSPLLLQIELLLSCFLDPYVLPLLSCMEPWPLLDFLLSLYFLLWPGDGPCFLHQAFPLHQASSSSVAGFPLGGVNADSLMSKIACGKTSDDCRYADVWYRFLV